MCLNKLGQEVYNLLNVIIVMKLFWENVNFYQYNLKMAMRLALLSEL